MFGRVFFFADAWRVRRYDEWLLVIIMIFLVVADGVGEGEVVIVPNQPSNLTLFRFVEVLLQLALFGLSYAEE
jgi:hypothetical protein